MRTLALISVALLLCFGIAAQTHTAQGHSHTTSGAIGRTPGTSASQPLSSAPEATTTDHDLPSSYPEDPNAPKPKLPGTDSVARAQHKANPSTNMAAGSTTGVQRSKSTVGATGENIHNPGVGAGSKAQNPPKAQDQPKKQDPKNGSNPPPTASLLPLLGVLGLGTLCLGILK